MVITDSNNKQKKHVVKTPLVARQLEEDIFNILEDSPTCTRESMRLILTVCF